MSLPSFSRREARKPTAREAIGHETELASYYRQIMTLKGERPRSGAVDYWLRLDFVSAQVGKEIGFPWWDRVSKAAQFLTWLRKANSKGDFFDAYQGWMLRAAQKGDRIHIQHSDLGTEEEFANLSVDRSTFLGRLDVAEAEVRQMIVALRHELGIDPWS